MATHLQGRACRQAAQAVPGQGPSLSPAVTVTTVTRAGRPGTCDSPGRRLRVRGLPRAAARRRRTGPGPLQRVAPARRRAGGQGRLSGSVSAQYDLRRCRAAADQATLSSSPGRGEPESLSSSTAYVPGSDS